MTKSKTLFHLLVVSFVSPTQHAVYILFDLMLEFIIFLLCGLLTRLVCGGFLLAEVIGYNLLFLYSSQISMVFIKVKQPPFKLVNIIFLLPFLLSFYLMRIDAKLFLAFSQILFDRAEMKLLYLNVSAEGDVCCVEFKDLMGSY